MFNIHAIIKCNNLSIVKYVPDFCYFFLLITGKITTCIGRNVTLRNLLVLSYWAANIPSFMLHSSLCVFDFLFKVQYIHYSGYVCELFCLLHGTYHSFRYFLKKNLSFSFIRVLTCISIKINIWNRSTLIFPALVQWEATSNNMFGLRVSHVVLYPDICTSTISVNFSFFNFSSSSVYT